MTRFWLLAILCMGMICGSAEARGRNRVMRYAGHSSQSRVPVQYSTGRMVYSSPQGQAGSSQHIQPVSYQSVSGNSFGQENSMQAWAEDEARMMAERGTCGHIRSAPPGCFVGVGCGMTCMGSGTLVAEAHYQGKMVRVWRR